MLGLCGDATPTPHVPDCEATLAPVRTGLATVEAGLQVIETLVGELVPTCGALWDSCMTATAVFADLPACEPQATYTPYATATSAPVLCRRCLAEEAEPFGCPPGWRCEQCEECHWLCVREEHPRADCNFCAGILIP